MEPDGPRTDWLNPDSPEVVGGEGCGMVLHRKCLSIHVPAQQGICFLFIL